MKREKFKSFLLISLILLSVFQLGILWDYSSHGFPFNFLREFKSSFTSNAPRELKGVFRPLRIIFSQGAYESHWLVFKDSDLQEEYTKTWEDAKSYIGKIISGSEIESITTTDKKWEELVLQKSIVIEFDTGFSADLVSYFMGVKPKSGDFNGFTKMILAPWENINYNAMTVYVLDHSSKIQKYVINTSKQELNKEYYDAAMAKMKKLEANGTLRSYSILGETKFKLPYAIRQDMPVVSYGSKYDAIGQIHVSLPDFMRYSDRSSFSEIEDKLSFLLGKDKDSYDISIDRTETVIMKNLKKIYKVYKKGVLEYKNLSTTFENKGSEVDAYIAAQGFMQQVGLIPPNVQVYLSSITEGKDGYRFTFDYMIAGWPIHMNLGQIGKDKVVLQNAVVIEANEKEVLTCNWVLRNMETSKDKKILYNINFIDLMDRAFNEYPTMREEKDFAVKDGIFAYIINDNETAQKLEPYWVVVTGNNSYYGIKLPVKKGE